MKSPTEVFVEVSRRVVRFWHFDVTGDSSGWPHQLPLGTLSGPPLKRIFATEQQSALTWKRWARERGLTLVEESRLVLRTRQAFPTHLVVPDVDTAVSLLGADQRQRVARGRVRAARLAADFPQLTTVAGTVRAVDGYTDTDFELLCAAAAWFACNTAAGLTPRQVPLEGLHAKWLNTHQPLICRLAGVGKPGLLPRHPPRIHFTYLDPDYLRSGGRRHDSATVGDTFTPADKPKVVVISENKDTAIHFPQLVGGISVEGVGFTGAAAMAQLPWLAHTPQLVYWGDMDSAGFEIVSRYRSTGLRVDTVLMNLPTYLAYERFGTNTDAEGKPLPQPEAKPLPTLTDGERQLYDQLTDPVWGRFLWVEQERIPLEVALRAVRTVCKVDIDAA